MMFTPCWPRAGPTGGAGLAAPAWICSLMRPATFFFAAMVRVIRVVVVRQRRWRLVLDDLVERQLDGGLAAEDLDQARDALRLDVDLRDRRMERRERSIHDGDGVADGEVDLGDLRGRDAAT